MIPGIVAQAMPGHSTPLPTGIVLVGFKTYQWSSGINRTFDFTDLAGGIASQPQIGDLCIMIASESEAVAGVPGYTAPAGHVETFLNRGVSETNDLATRGAYGFYEAGSASGGIWHTSQTRTRVGTIVVFRGVASVAPWAQTAGSNSRIPNPPAVTPTETGAVIITWGGASNRSNAAFDDPVDMDLLYKYSGNTTGADIATMMGIKRDWASGAFDPAPFEGGGTSTSDAWIAATLVLNPAA